MPSVPRWWGPVGVLCGVAWAARAAIAIADPVYYAPSTALDYAAVMAGSAALALLAAGVWGIGVAGSRAVSWSRALAAIGLLTAAVANLAEDGLGLPVGAVYVAAVLVGTLSLLAFGIALVRSRASWRGTLVLLSLAGLLLSSTLAGGAILAVSWAVTGMRVLRRTR